MRAFGRVLKVRLRPPVEPFQAPQVGTGVVVCHREDAPVVAEGEAGTAVAARVVEGVDQCAGGRVPYADGGGVVILAALRGGDQVPAVWSECHALDAAIVVALIRRGAVGYGHVVRVERDVPYWLLVRAVKARDQPPGGDIPDEDTAVGVGSGEGLAV